MAYRKLTAEVVEALLSLLEMPLAMGYRLYSVRGICEKVGISHMTFYRWLSAYRHLKDAEKPTAAREALLLKFGRGVDAYLRLPFLSVARSGAASAVASDLGVFANTEGMGSEGVDAAPQAAAPQTDAIRKWEKRTTALAGSAEFSEFDAPDFSLKSK